MSKGHSPLTQFEIIPLVEMQPLFGRYNIDFTNASAFMVLAVVAVAGFMLGGIGRRALVPGHWQSMVELTYEFVAGMVKDTVGSAGRQYFPMIFSVFLFVLCLNLLGMIPFSFTVTSHIIVTFALAAFIFIGVTLVAIYKQGLGGFLAHFLPQGTPWWMAPLIYVIEVISYLARPCSLSIRLAANMMAGHTMMKVVAGFIVSMLAAESIIVQSSSVVPFGFTVLLTAFEFLVAFLQAYIFTILSCVYLSDALHESH